jgi:DNA invertase Pin-like site-specific DNA recombinase
MRLAAYHRVSTDTQAEEGNGLDVQARMIAAWADKHGHTVVLSAQDAGISGTKPVEGRPGLGRALDAVRTGEADGLVVRDLDRLARSVTVQEAVLAELWRRDEVQVFAATTGQVLRDDPDDPYRTAMREMAGVFAGLERRMLVKRMRDGRKAKAARGGHAVGAPPYGWTAELGELLAKPEEQAALLRMVELHRQHMTTREIAVTLAAEGHPTKRGGRWTSAVVSRILSRPQPVLLTHES